MRMRTLRPAPSARASGCWSRKCTLAYTKYNVYTSTVICTLLQLKRMSTYMVCHCSGLRSHGRGLSLHRNTHGLFATAVVKTLVGMSGSKNIAQKSLHSAKYGGI